METGAGMTRARLPAMHPAERWAATKPTREAIRPIHRIAAGPVSTPVLGRVAWEVEFSARCTIAIWVLLSLLMTLSMGLVTSTVSTPVAMSTFRSVAPSTGTMK